MALYIPAARRRRRLVTTAAVAATIGLGVGVGVGRVTAPSPASSAAEAKDNARRVTGQLRSLPLEYGKALNDPGSRTAFDASLAAGLQRADDALGAAFADAPWIDGEVRAGLRSRVSALGPLAERNVDPAEFEAAVAAAADAVAAAFGST